MSQLGHRIGAVDTAMAEGFTGYSLPDDLLSGTGLRVVTQGMMSLPIVGTWMHWGCSAAIFPGTAFYQDFTFCTCCSFPRS